MLAISLGFYFRIEYFSVKAVFVNPIASYQSLISFLKILLYLHQVFACGMQTRGTWDLAPDQGPSAESQLLGHQGRPMHVILLLICVTQRDALTSVS